MTDTPEEEPANGDSPPAVRRRVVPVLTGGLAVVVAGLLVLGLRVTGVWEPDPDSAPEVTGTPEPTATSPFAGTPAEDFAEGAAGIVLPPAEPVGDFTAEQVTNALEQVRRALIAARLDHTMLIDHDPEPFIALLAPAQQPAVREAFDSTEFATFATLVADDAARIPAPPRVTGRVTYRTTTAERGLPVLEVKTNFVWVYALGTPGGVAVVVVRDELVWQVLHADAFLEPSRGLRLSEGESSAWGVDCDAYERGLFLPGHSGLGENADAVFDPERPLRVAESC